MIDAHSDSDEVVRRRCCVASPGCTVTMGTVHLSRRRQYTGFALYTLIAFTPPHVRAVNTNYYLLTDYVYAATIDFRMLSA